MSNGSNYITGGDEPSKTFVVYRAGCGAMDQYQVHCLVHQSCRACSGVAMVTIANSENHILDHHHLGKEA